MKKIVRILTILSVFLLAQWTLQAQRPFPGPPHRGPGLEKFAEELGLTDEQKTELKALRESGHEDMKALMEKEYENPEARREAMKALADEQREAVDAVLTAAQREKLATLQAEAQAKRTEERKANAEKHKAMREELKTYRETEIMPVLRAQRTKLESQLSAEDKAAIAALRVKRPAHVDAPRPAERPNPEMRGKRPELTEAQKAEMKADREKIKALVDKYDSQITALLEEIDDERETWKDHTQEVFKKYAPEGMKERPTRQQGTEKMKGQRTDGEKRTEKPGKGAGERPHHMQMDREGMGKVGFLLLDPNASAQTSTANKEDFAKMRIFPNPSGTRNTVSYQLTEAGHYRVELRDKDGLVLQVLSNDFYQSGDYKQEIDLSTYAAGTYYVSIVGAEGVVSQKMVVAK